MISILVATPAAEAGANPAPGSAGRPRGAAGAPASRAPSTAPATKGPVIGDLNSDRAVNILDALLLAQEIARKASGDAAWLAQRDLNADGKVDQKDVDAIALRAVNLELVALYWDLGRMIAGRQAAGVWKRFANMSS